MMRSRKAWALLLLPCVALAALSDDYAWQWPLTLQDADAGAYRVELDASVYAAQRYPEVTWDQVFTQSGFLVARPVE